MSNLEAAQADFAKKDKRLRFGIGVLLTYVVVMLSFVAVMTLITQNTIKDNQAANAKASEQRFARYTADNAKQHQITQAYIRCIADALLVPVSDRKPGAFDACGVEAKKSLDAETSGGSEDTTFLTPTKNSASSSPAATTNPPSNTPPQTPQEPIVQPPVVTAPPDPDRPLLVLPLPLLHLRIGDILQVGN